MQKQVLFLILISWVVGVGELYAQSAGYNYIRVDSILVAGVHNDGQVGQQTGPGIQTTITYLDGIGRPVQSILVGKSPSLKDIVSIHVYEPRGNESIHYLPFTKAANNGLFIANPVELINAFYQNPPQNSASTSFPYSQSVFEPSPLNRIIRQSAPGESWNLASDHTRNTDYRLDNLEGLQAELDKYHPLG